MPNQRAIESKRSASNCTSIRLARPDELLTLVSIDDEACQLYTRAGMPFALDENHPFLIDEAQRWGRTIDEGRAHVAVDAQDQPIGFIALGIVDQEPYLDQISVRPSAMRRGIGAALLHHAISWSGERPLWLTTYAHVPWNRPYYERHGFVTVPETAWGPELRVIIQEQREALPAPCQRIAMVRRPGASHTSSC